MASGSQRIGAAYTGVSASQGSSSYRGSRHDSLASAGDSVIADDMQLIYLCSIAFAPRDASEQSRLEAEESWEPVREWLRSHSAEEVRQAAEKTGEGNMTALHFACRNGPPSDVIDVFLSVATESVAWVDTFGWLPIHYACACGAETQVIKKLAEVYPESKTTVDRRGRTPLHFALGTSGNNDNVNQLASPDVVALLSSTGAAKYADDNGMLPLHYACAYGASEESLLVLTRVHMDAITTMDVRFRTPLHFALSNAGRSASPGAVRHILRLNPSLVNSIGGSPLPLRVLADYSHTLKKTDDDRERRENVQKCLEHLLNNNPDPTADFLTALQGLPDWLSERAVVMPSVQVLLNDKISQRFPTAVLLLDFYFLALIIVFYSVNVSISLDNRFDPTKDNAVATGRLIPLYLGVAYFLLREIIQIVSLVALKSFHIWVYDPNNWLNMTFIFLVFYWTILMQTGEGDDKRFRTGTAITVMILWIKVLAFLRNMLIDFAVFVGGVFYVVQRLVAFLISLGVILIAFSQMFVTVYQQSPECILNDENPRSIEEVRCEDPADSFPYCNFWTSFLNVYTMLLGEVDDTLYTSSTFATVLFVVYMFLVVILLANVLIAIVTDSYKVIQDQRAAIVFWTNRLDFVSQMDAVVFRGSQVKQSIGVGGNDEGASGNGKRDKGSEFGSDFWKRLIYLFEDDIDESILSLEFWVYVLLRVVTALVIIPLWVLLGLVTAGWLWPPQIRETIFTRTVNTHSDDAESQDDKRKTQVLLLEKEVKQLRDELEEELRNDRSEVVQMKSSIAERKTEIAAEMRQIKRIMAMLFEQHSALD